MDEVKIESINKKVDKVTINGLLFTIYKNKRNNPNEFDAEFHCNICDPNREKYNPVLVKIGEISSPTLICRSCISKIDKALAASVFNDCKTGKREEEIPDKYKGKIYAFDVPPLSASVSTQVWSVKRIIKEYYPSWRQKMMERNKDKNLITIENCIEDFITINFAYEYIKEKK